MPQRVQRGSAPRFFEPGEAAAITISPADANTLFGLNTALTGWRFSVAIPEVGGGTRTISIDLFGEIGRIPSGGIASGLLLGPPHRRRQRHRKPHQRPRPQDLAKDHHHRRAGREGVTRRLKCVLVTLSSRCPRRPSPCRQLGPPWQDRPSCCAVRLRQSPLP